MVRVVFYRGRGGFLVDGEASIPLRDFIFSGRREMKNEIDVFRRNRYAYLPNYFLGGGEKRSTAAGKIRRQREKRSTATKSVRRRRREKSATTAKSVRQRRGKFRRRFETFSNGNEMNQATIDNRFQDRTTGNVPFSVRSGIVWAILTATFAVIFLANAGCAVKMTELRRVSRSPLNERFKLNSPTGPQVSDRTKLILRAYCLDSSPKRSIETLVRLRREIGKNPDSELIASFAELAYFEAKRQELTNPEFAAEIYVAAAVHAYWYLFDPNFAKSRNGYDGRFRDVCLLYNGSLEGLLRLLQGDEKRLRLFPGTKIRWAIPGGRSWSVACEMATGNWDQNEIESFRFASDYEILGLENEYRQGGLGVPLIAQRKNGVTEKKEEKYYPKDLCFPVTAFLRPKFRSESPEPPPFVSIYAPKNADSPNFANRSNSPISPNSAFQSSSATQPNFPDGSDSLESPFQVEAVLELYDPLVSTYTQVGNSIVPLESDLTTPLACFFTNPTTLALNTVGMLRPDELLKPIPGLSDSSARSLKGLYMMQPYEPNKIPVVMVHGLWSSPTTWIEMFNTLRSIDEIRENYQFWFYFYPSGQPFWVSASQLRDDLQEIRQTLDPNREDAALDETVLIGHSMGGLISRLQVMESGERFWNLISDAPFESVPLDADRKAELKKWFFFHPNPSIRRVVTIATPFEGSEAANDLTQWFAQRVISIPSKLDDVLKSILSLKSDFIKDDSLLEIHTSVDSLSPSCPFYQAMDDRPISPDIVCNNIVGVLPELENSWLHPRKSDGVVDYASSHREDVESEKEIPAAHMTVHTHPAAILETRRILIEHLAQARQNERERIDKRLSQR